MHFIIAKFLAEVGIFFVETDPETGKTQPVILSLFREIRCYLWNVSWFLAKKPKRSYYYYTIIKRDLYFFMIVDVRC